MSLLRFTEASPWDKSGVWSGWTVFRCLCRLSPRPISASQSDLGHLKEAPFLWMLANFKWRRKFVIPDLGLNVFRHRGQVTIPSGDTGEVGDKGKTGERRFVTEDTGPEFSRSSIRVLDHRGEVGERVVAVVGAVLQLSWSLVGHLDHKGEVGETVEAVVGEVSVLPPFGTFDAFIEFETRVAGDDWGA